MPIYEYRCEACGNHFEKLVRGSSTAVACPTCGGARLEQQYSTFSAQMGAGGAKSEPCAPMACGGGCGAGMCGMPGFCSKN